MVSRIYERRRELLVSLTGLDINRVSQMPEWPVDNALNKLYSQLTSREKEILQLRYGAGDGYTYTLEEVGRIINVSPERVRQIAVKALRKAQSTNPKDLEMFLQ